MILQSFSKINLSLNVFKRLKKKRFHEIDSYFCLISLSDTIRIKRINTKKDQIQFKGAFSNLISRTNNSIIDTLNILRKKKIIYNFYSILIEKKIPVFSGLGGGTSNSASLIKYFIKKKMNKELLEILTKKIGSDLRLFFHDQGFLKGLKDIKKLKKKHIFHFLLIYPNIKCSSRDIYAKLNRFSKKKYSGLSVTDNRKKFLKFLINSKNDLQSVVENKYPKIKKLIKELRQYKGCYFSRMTGSGSICYGIFKNKKTAKAAQSKIKLKYPKYWSSVAKTI